MHLDLGLGFLKTFELFVKFFGWVLCFLCYMIMHCIPLAFSQCFMHLDVCLIVENCVMLGLDWVEPKMQLFLARHMIMHISCIRTLSFLSLYFIVIVFYFFFSLSLSFSNRLHMAPKQKSTSTWNPFCSGSSSSTDLPPLHVRFSDEKA